MIEIALTTGYNRFEWIHLTYTKEEIPVEVVLTPIQVKGRQYLYTVWRDISERVKAEAEIKQKNEQLKELLSTREKFFAIIAHDLKSPFQGLLGLTQIIAENPENFTLKELAGLTTGLHQTASNLYSLLRNLLEWAQIQRGSFSFSPQLIVLETIVSDNIQLLRKRAREKKISLRSTIKPEMQIYADSNMVNSLVLNLITNAMKFTNAGGRVTISAKQNKEGMIQVSVKDNGIGMPEEISEKVFQAGEKVKRKGTDGELSTGLGLILCKEFVELNGGTIWLKSEEGAGTTFYFTLPIKSNN